MRAATQKLEPACAEELRNRERRRASPFSLPKLQMPKLPTALPSFNQRKAAPA